MRFFIAVAILLGLVNVIDSTCSVSVCKVVISCSELPSYKDCLQDQLSGCTDADSIIKWSLETMITAVDGGIAECGATSVSVSMATLVMAATLAYLKGVCNPNF